MLRRLVGALAFTLPIVIAAPGGAGEPQRAGPMQFSIRQEGPASACRDKCRTWVAAAGMIRPETARDFDAFAERNNIRGALLVLESEGGSVLGALALGRAIRRLDMTTTIGRSVDLPAAGRAEDVRSMIVPRADCESMCAFVLLAGTKRSVPPEARVRVHQIWLGDRREDATAATYSAEDMVLVQRDIGKLAQYTIEMGGSAELLEVSLRIPPWEPMRSLTREELRRMRLDIAEGREAAAPASSAIASAEEKRLPAAAATTSAPPAAQIPTMRRIAPNSERGWSLIQESGISMLVRRHPLTIEGETIGSFDVMLGCADNPNEFTILYNETRRSRSGYTPDPLRQVTVSLGQKTTNLGVAAPDLAVQRGERDSFASGVLPANVVRGFGEAGSHSITLMTSNGSNASTVIRIGNTGVTQNLPALIAACAQQSRTAQAGLSRPD